MHLMSSSSTTLPMKLRSSTAKVLETLLSPRKSDSSLLNVIRSPVEGFKLSSRGPTDSSDDTSERHDPSKERSTIISNVSNTDGSTVISGDVLDPSTAPSVDDPSPEPLSGPDPSPDPSGKPSNLPSNSSVPVPSEAVSEAEDGYQTGSDTPLADSDGNNGVSLVESTNLKPGFGSPTDRVHYYCPKGTMVPS